MTHLRQATGRFHPIWLGMDAQARAALAMNLRTSQGYLEQLAGGYKLPSLQFAARMVELVPGLSYQGLVDANRQRKILRAT